MDIFGIGPLEVILILLIALIVLGPGDMAKTGRTVGRLLRNIVTSQWWRDLRSASTELRKLPYRLMREVDAENIQHEIQKPGTGIKDINLHPKIVDNSDFRSWTTLDQQANMSDVRHVSDIAKPPPNQIDNTHPGN